MASKSERAAWQEVREQVKRILQLTVKDAGRLGAVRDVAWELDALAADMLTQLGRGLHANPGLVVYGNPLVKQRGRQPSGIISRRVYAIEYKHVDDGADYRHDFTPGVHMYAFGGDGSLSLHRPDGKPISREFDV